MEEPWGGVRGCERSEGWPGRQEGARCSGFWDKPSGVSDDGWVTRLEFEVSVGIGAEA